MANTDYFFQGAPANLSPAEVANQYANLRLSNQKQQENAMTLKTMAQQQQEDQATRQALASSVNPDGTINRQAALSKLASNPQTAMTANKLYQEWMKEDVTSQKLGFENQKAEREARAAQLKATKDEADLIGQLTSGVKDQPTYEAALGYAKSKNLDVTGFPQQYDPGLVNQYRTRALDVKTQTEMELKRIDDQLKQEQFGETKRHNKAMENKPNASIQLNYGTPQTGVDPTTGKAVTYVVDKGGNVKYLPVEPTQSAGGKTKFDPGAAAGILDEAESLLDKAPGSWAGAGLNAIKSKGLSISTETSQAQAKLQALQAALMMRMPRMEGPQSDKDVALYREQAGRIADPTVPSGDKKAAIASIRNILTRYAAPKQAQSVTKVNPANGKTYYQHSDGNFYLQPPGGGQ